MCIFLIEIEFLVGYSSLLAFYLPDLICMKILKIIPDYFAFEVRFYEYDCIAELISMP